MIIIWGIAKSEVPEIKSFLLEYQTNLGVSLDPIYDTLNTISLDKWELLQLSATDLRSLLDSQSLDNRHIDRLINTLHHIEDSKIYKDQINTLSPKEQIALEEIFNTSNKLQQHIENITISTNELQTNYQSAETKINEKFDALITGINQRRNDLLKQLNDLKQSKSTKLNKQKKELQSYNAKLLYFYNKAQNMTHDTTLHPNERERIILRKSAQILGGNNILTNFKQSTDGYIGISIVNAKKLISDINNLGTVSGRKYEICTQQTNVREVDKTPFTFGTITNGFKHWIFDHGKRLKVMDKMDGFITACNRKSYDVGIHTFVIHVSGKVSGKNALSIVSGTMPTNKREWIGKHRYTHYYFDSKTGAIYTGDGKKVSKLWKWEKNDVIVMRLDCNEWTLSFEIERDRYPPIVGEKIKIAKNKYYTCMTVAPKKGVKFDIVDATR